MHGKSPLEGKTDAENEPHAFRGGVSVLAIHISGAGRGHQANRPRPPALRRLRVHLLFRGAVRVGMADVPGARLKARAHSITFFLRNQSSRRSRSRPPSPGNSKPVVWSCSPAS